MKIFIIATKTFTQSLFTLTHNSPVLLIYRHSSDSRPPTSSFKGSEVNFHYLPRREEIRKMKKRQVFLMGGVRGRGVYGWHFSYLTFTRFIILTFRSYFIKLSSAADISSQFLVRPAADDDFV